MTQPSIHNWGRWGEDDQLGTLNLQTPQSILRALQLVKRGKIYNLSVPLEKDGPQHPMFHKTWQTTFLTTNEDPCAFQVADDVVTMVTHSGTHMDALGHCWNEGTLRPVLLQRRRKGHFMGVDHIHADISEMLHEGRAPHQRAAANSRLRPRHCAVGDLAAAAELLP